jgi:hypothetical protein
MRSTRISQLFVVALSLAVAAGVALVAVSRSNDAIPGARQMTERKMPGVVRRHMADLRQALPGVGGESGAAGSRGDERFLAMAYPDTDIPLARLAGARAAAAAVRNRNFPTGKGRPGTWITVGPSEALYPATPFRNSFGYVPTRYVAGGRTTAIAIDPACAPGQCRLWIFAAGGGVWRTKNALSGQPNWQFLSGGFGINSGSSITLDPNDPTGNTLYVGTGEANASGDSAAGVGLYKSTDGGDTWTGPLGASVFAGRAIGTIAVAAGAPNVLYVGTARGVLGVSSVSGGAISLIPGAAAWGLYKSIDGGASWTFLHNGAPTAAACDTVAEATAGGSPCSVRGVRRVALDPSNPNVVYAGSFGRGVWRSVDAGATWTVLKPALNAADINMRPEFAVTSLAAGTTRMYVYEGSTGNPTARLFRSDDVAAAVPAAFANLSSADPANLGYGTHNLCTGQCVYDNFVYTPAGHPDVVYIGGSYSYGEAFSNKRGVVLSTDAGVSATDMTMDATDIYYPNGLHPDQHALVTNPSNPFQFFEVNDGGVMRSSGQFADVSAWCDDPNRGLAEPQLSRCRQLLSRVPTELEGLNHGLTTLQFQSLSVSPFNANLLQGGTQDNGTWQTPGNPVKWENTMIGDGGQSGFDAAVPPFRFHTFFNATPDVNFSNGDIADWNWMADPIYSSGEPQAFYVPIISDPVVSRSMFTGLGHVWRTKTWGLGTSGVTEFRARCNEWTGTFDDYCGDWVPLGATYAFPGYPFLQSAASYASTRLTANGALYGADRAGGNVVAVERATGNTSTLWAATSVGRVFISRNVDAEPASAVTFTRLDALAPNDPGRFVSGIHIDPANPNRAWISYSGFDATTAPLTGHVFEVTYDSAANTVTWVDRSYDVGDIPITDIARDDVTGDLYAASDFGVFRLAAGTTSWTAAAPGMPNVEVSGLTILPASRRLYAATHGMGAWRLNLP